MKQQQRLQCACDAGVPMTRIKAATPPTPPPVLQCINNCMLFVLHSLTFLLFLALFQVQLELTWLKAEINIYVYLYIFTFIYFTDMLCSLILENSSASCLGQVTPDWTADSLQHCNSHQRSGVRLSRCCACSNPHRNSSPHTRWCATPPGVAIPRAVQSIPVEHCHPDDPRLGFPVEPLARAGRRPWPSVA